MQQLGLPILALIFVASASVVWWSGVRLTDATDALDQRLGLSDALGGMLLLTIAAALPEIAITVTAVLQDHVGLAIGNLLGGVAIHSVVLVVLDVAGAGRNPPLSRRTRTLIPALQGLWAIGILALVLMGSQLEPLVVARVEPTALLVVVLWIVGVMTIQRAGKGTMWTPEDEAEGEPKKPNEEAGKSMTRTGGIFAFAAVLTLIAGAVLERSGSAIASRLGMEGVVFGATVLAVAAAIPEVSTGVEAVKRGDHQLAISDIFGINAFFLALLLVIGVISGQAVIATIAPTSLYLAAFAVLLMLVSVTGLLVRSGRTVLRMGADSLAVLIVYVVGIAGLLLVS